MASREETSCPACGEKVLATARKCKHCGEWFATPSVRPSPPPPPPPQPPTAVPTFTAAPTTPPPVPARSSNGLVSTFVVLFAIAGLSAALLHKRSEDRQVAARRAADSIAAVVAREARDGDWGDAPGYTVVLASEPSREQAERVLRRARQAGVDAGLLRSGAYASLRPGYWVVYAGRFSQKREADAEMTRLRRLGFSIAYSRFVSVTAR